MQRLQLDAIEEDHLVGHRIPKKFRKKKSHPHDLSDAVLANRAGDLFCSATCVQAYLPSTQRQAYHTQWVDKIIYEHPSSYTYISTY